MLLKKNSWPYLALFAALVIFYPELFLVKAAPLAADHLEQHYPWASLLAEHVKQFHLPFWTPLIQCGFPIAAEGQIGIFYLPNLLLSLLLPFEAAYSFTPLFHFFFSGWGTYLYARKMKLEPLPAFTAAFIFVFGTAYGGAYYNITSLKTIAWFPWCLYFFESYYRGGGLRYLLLLSLAIFQALMAGYLQVAILAVAILSAVICFRLFIFHDSSARKRRVSLLPLGLSLGLAILLSLPQLFLTFQLAMLSNRVVSDESYAYVGSMSPVALATMMLPILQGLFRGNSLYGGLFSVILILFAVLSPEVRKEKSFRLWASMGILSLLLALGEWSPVYVGLVKLTHFYAFRTPMKFLIFICFSLALLSGLGLQQALRSGRSADAVSRKVSTGFLWLAGVTLAGSFAVGILLTYFRPQVELLGHWFIQNYIYGKAGHPHSLEIYSEKLTGYLNSAIRLVLARDPWQIWGYSLLAIHAGFVLWLRGAGKVTRPWLVTGLVLLCFDLYIFSFRDIKRDFDYYDRIKPDAAAGFLLEENKKGNVGRIYTLRNAHENFFMLPSVNMIYGLEDIGAYSPLVYKKYYESIGQLGNVNDSNAPYVPTTEFVLSHLDWLQFLGVTHIITRRPLEHAELKPVFEAPDTTRVYALKSEHQPVYFVTELKTDWEEDFIPPSPTSTIRLQRDSGEKSEWQITAKEKGFMILPRSYDPAWSAQLNGEPVTMHAAYGLFQAVEIPAAGNYTLHLSYAPWKAMAGKKS